MQLKILKAGNGDSILMSLKIAKNITKNILIDGGNNYTDFKNNLKKEILRIQQNKEFIDLLIITHIDQDHIKGIEFLLKDNEIDKNIIKEIWFNFFSISSTINNDISFNEALRVEKLINHFNFSIKRNISVEQIPRFSFSDITLTILSPQQKDIKKLIRKNKDISGAKNDYDYSIHDLILKNPRIFIDKKEDLNTSVENKSSIAFLLEHQKYKILFLGDAEPSVIHSSLRKILKERKIKNLYIDYTKLSHHGSHKNFGMDFFNYIQCNNFIFSANGKKENLPNKLIFAKILNRDNRDNTQDKFYFNYSSVLNNLNFTEEEMNEFNFKCFSENYEHGYKIML